METILLQLFKDVKIDFTRAYLIPDSGEGNLGSTFDLNPKNFLRFAKQDLKLKDDRGIINSLTNAKRAIDCQTDEALDKCGFKTNDFEAGVKDFISHFELKDDVPIKLKIIHALNLAPSILIAKTRNIRNKLEHLYRKPSIDEAQEALEVAELFIRSIEGKFRLLTTDFFLTDEKNYNEKNQWTISNGLYFAFSTKEKNFRIEKIVNGNRTAEVLIDVCYIEYFGLLRLMFSIDDDIDIEETLKVLLKQILHPIPTDKVSLIQG